jgi:hypothetical protein
VLQKTLDEKATDMKLTKLAESKVNLRAASRSSGRLRRNAARQMFARRSLLKPDRHSGAAEVTRRAG